MRFVDEFRDAELGRALAGEILSIVEPGRHYKVMEVCGGHTHAIYKYGIDDLLPENVELVQLLLELGAHRLEQLERRGRLGLVDHGDREPDVDQDPVTGPEIVEEADVDGAPDPGNVDSGELVGLVDDFHDLAGDGQAHSDPPKLGWTLLTG